MNLKRTISLLACLFILSAANAVPLRGKDGKAVPGTDRDNPASWAGIPMKLTKAAAPGEYSQKGIPLGKHEDLVILVDFPDRKFSIKDKNVLVGKYNEIFNQKGYYEEVLFKGNPYTIDGSIRDYFIDQSYGKFEPSFRIIGPITTDSNHDRYGKDRGGSDADSVISLVREVCRKAAKIVDLDSYALDGDSLIEHLSIIYAGRGQNYDGAEVNSIWPQSNTVRIRQGKVKDVCFICTCELFWDTDDILDGIGTFCHEYSHMLGLPDFYSTRYGYDNVSNAFMGRWSLMDYGTYENLGFSPTGYTAFERYSLGWLELTEITEQGRYSMPALNSDDPVAYRLNTAKDDCFLILENHQQQGWFKYQVSRGLMVTSVSYNYTSWYNNNVNSDDNSKRYFLLPADNDRSRNSGKGDLFPWGSQDSITWYSLPQLAVPWGSNVLKPDYSVYDICDNDGIVSFLVGKDRTAGTIGLTASSAIQVFDLSGRLRMTVTDESDIPSGMWIIRQDNETKKVKR